MAAEAERLQVADVIGATLVPPLRGRLRLREHVVHQRDAAQLMPPRAGQRSLRVLPTGTPSPWEILRGAPWSGWLE
jgi:hypothetical protein